MNSAKIIADSTPNELIFTSSTKALNKCAFRILDFADYQERVKRLGLSGTDPNYVEALKSSVALVFRELEILSDALEIRAEVHNKAQKSLDKSAKKILNKQKDIQDE